MVKSKVRELDVYLGGSFVGRPTEDTNGNMRFLYDADWLKSPNVVPLSHSLPLRSERFTNRECRGYFGGILPEQHPREVLARNLGTSLRNDFSMLREIGGECAGSVTFLPHEADFPTSQADYRALTDAELADCMRQLPNRPLLAGEAGVRMSLAGAQNKLAVALIDEQFHIPLGGTVTTHIIKPAIPAYPGIVQNEQLCLRLAAEIGIPTAVAQARRVEDVEYLLVTRYDRTSDGSGRSTRIHQEDFCQALGVISERKYQREGGPSLKDCFQLTRESSSVPAIDLRVLLEAVIFNFLIGNADANAKNYSLLYQGKETRLAPLYDIVCTRRYPLDTRMAMKIGGEYDPDQVQIYDFERLAEESGLARPIARRQLVSVCERLLDRVTKMPREIEVERIVQEFTEDRCRQTIAAAKRARND